MSKKYEITENFKINPSLLLIKWLVISHILSIIAVILSSVALVVKTLLVITIVFSFLFHIKKQLEFDGVLVRHSTARGWELADLDSNYYSIEVLPSTVITSILLILHFKQQSKQKQTILICKDALINDDYRKLMVALRISGLKKDLYEPR